MKIVQVEDVASVRGLEHRGGTFHAKTLVEGTPGSPDNFKFSLSRLGTDYSGPRHRHNFDQFRYMIDEPEFNINSSDHKKSLLYDVFGLRERNAPAPIKRHRTGMSGSYLEMEESVFAGPAEARGRSARQ